MTGHAEVERFEAILATCVADLLREMGLPAERLDGEHAPEPARESLLGFCGFGSMDLRGSIALMGSLPLFSRLHPLPATVTPRDLADWACELVNQVVGRYRNRLLAYNVSLAPGAPQSALAEHVRLSSRLRHLRPPLCFTIHGLVLETWLELAIRPGFTLIETPTDKRAAALQEGSALFF
jgi:hypothetical protein